MAALFVLGIFFGKTKAITCAQVKWVKPTDLNKFAFPAGTMKIFKTPSVQKLLAASKSTLTLPQLTGTHVVSAWAGE